MNTNFTPGPWIAFRMVDEDGNLLTPEAVGEYMKNSTIVGLEETGRLDFYGVSCTKHGGDADVCFTGNGPTSAFNAALIAAAPDLYDALEPFANYACGCGECQNCKALAAIKRACGE